MSRDSLRFVIAAGLLTAGLIGATLFVWLPARWNAEPTGAGRTFVSDIDNWRQTDQWRILHTPYNLSLSGNLNDLPLQLGPWHGEEIPQTNLEVFILLEPEQYVYRRYTDEAGHVVWLSLIGSRKSKSFHPPQVCYSADGWQTRVSSAPLALDKGQVYALQVDATKNGQRHLVSYFYLWPKPSRDLTDGTVLFKVTVPLSVDAGPEEAIYLTTHFVRQVFTAGATAKNGP